MKDNNIHFISREFWKTNNCHHVTRHWLIVYWSVCSFFHYLLCYVLHGRLKENVKRKWRGRNKKNNKGNNRQVWTNILHFSNIQEFPKKLLNIQLASINATNTLLEFNINYQRNTWYWTFSCSKMKNFLPASHDLIVVIFFFRKEN